MWFLDKLRETATERLSPGKCKKGAAFPNVLTPDRIPDFFIPPKLTAPRCRPAPGLPEAASGPFAELHVIRVDSAEDAPADLTCSDPQSQAALSLPHLLKAPTSYGFCTLLESPHTRRKESLFHGAPVNLLAKPSAPPRSRSGRLGPRRGTWDSDTASSAESSPFGSPLLSRVPPRSAPFFFKASGQEKWPPRGFRAEARDDSLSTEEGSSAESSPYAARRASEESCGSPIFTLDQRSTGNNTVYLDRGGLLRMAAKHCGQNQRLKVRLISAEGLYDKSVAPSSISCCVSLSLLPGRRQKQSSTIIRKSRNPVFNEDFFFDGVAADHLCTTSLKIKAMNKVSSVKRDQVLGERELGLVSVLAL
uniref:C2 calcium-dependent domain-containing protein 4C-like isoform X2 n=1 Tax=Geotrypetes seraphini TaxID=260995 RepID=A0A6P8PIH7_GEOSA|nr:C2 calcium-dependent domain-containing protein 4C-like isoform X2 [Geotrypetes seraphini]